MRKIFIAALLALSLLASAVNTYAYSPDSEISADLMLDTIRDITAIPRGIKDESVEDARQYVIDTFNFYGLEVSTQSFVTTLTDGNGEPYTAVNITGTLAPDPDTDTGDILIIAAHYDGASGFPAANDNGSGLAVLFELVRLLHDTPTDTEIRFVSFDAEEPGIVGSEYYVSHLGEDQNRVIGMLNFDMLAGKRDGEVRIDTIDGYSNYLFELLKSDPSYSHIQPHRQEVGISDHQSFAARAIPILYFEHPAIWDEIHKATDTIDTISPDMLVFAANAGLTVARKIMSDDTPSFIDEAYPETDVTIYQIQQKTYLPLGVSAKEFEKESGIHLNQVPSSDSGSVYSANVRLFGLDKTFSLTAYDRDTSNAISSIYINLSNGDFAKIKSAISSVLGSPEKKSGAYRWHNIYGNTYTLTNDVLHIYPYSLSEEENYTVDKEGELVHIAGMPTTDTAQAVWERIKPLLTRDEYIKLSSVRVTTDGIGSDLTVKMTMSDGALKLDVDFADVLNKDGECYSDTDLSRAMDIARVLCTGKSDVPDLWAYDDTVNAMKYGIMDGYMAYGFTENISRLDFCRMAYNLLKDKITEINPSTFTDVKSDAVDALAGLDIISGRDDEHFAPNDEITREEAAVVLANISEYLGFETTSAKIFVFSDNSDISSWARASVYKMRNIGIMSGMDYNSFLPKGKYTKQHATATLMRIYYKMNA